MIRRSSFTTLAFGFSVVQLIFTLLEFLLQITNLPALSAMITKMLGALVGIDLMGELFRLLLAALLAHLPLLLLRWGKKQRKRYGFVGLGLEIATWGLQLIPYLWAVGELLWFFQFGTSRSCLTVAFILYLLAFSFHWSFD